MTFVDQRTLMDLGAVIPVDTEAGTITLTPSAQVVQGSPDAMAVQVEASPADQTKVMQSEAAINDNADVTLSELSFYRFRRTIVKRGPGVSQSPRPLFESMITFSEVQQTAVCV
jgi:hypothetical protein